MIKLEADIAKQLEQARYRYRPDNRFVVIKRGGCAIAHRKVKKPNIGFSLVS